MPKACLKNFYNFNVGLLCCICRTLNFFKVPLKLVDFWYKTRISSSVVSGVRSPIAETPTWGLLSGDGCQWPQWIPQWYSLRPAILTCSNIFW